MSRGKKIGLAVATAIVVATLLIISEVVCISAWIRYGMVVPECPSGDVVQGVAVHAYGLRRGSSGTVEISAVGNYTSGPADRALSAPLGRVDATLELLVDDQATPLVPKDGWSSSSSGLRGSIVLPSDLADGTHKLRARVDSPLGEAELEVPVDVYAPAKIHVITDRPLYEPGNTISFRSTVLRARDLAPLEGRPGRFVVVDANRTIVLDERVAAGDYGVASGTFPVDAAAPIGDWTIRWISGSASGERTVRVGPFELPRFSIEASAGRPHYTARQTPKLRGTVRYSSGAPVGGARVNIDWRTSGEWQPPRTFSDALPKKLIADESGRFEVVLPPVPRDLRDEVRVVASMQATDAAGDSVAGAASLLLSEDDIAVDVVTELADGLVDGFNNRVYLRATTPSKVPLAGAKLVVKRAWDASDKGVEAVADEDGVAAFQLDPGPPVNVVVEPMPYRPPPPTPALRIDDVREKIGERYDIADRKVISNAETKMSACAHLADSDVETVNLSMSVAADGRIADVSASGTLAGQCLGEVVRSIRFRAGADRLYEVSLTLSPSLPRIHIAPTGVPTIPNQVSSALERATRRARSCLTTYASRASLPRLLTWRLAGSGKLEVRFGRDPSVTGLKTPSRVTSCIEGRLRRANDDLGTLSAADKKRFGRKPHFGFARFTISPNATEEGRRPRATTFLGYELKVVATAKDGEEIGDTTTTVRPGTIPPFRLRATPTIASPKDTVEVAFLRGPGWEGELPEKVWLRSHSNSIEAIVDQERRAASFVLPSSAEGWFELSWGGGRALVFVRPDKQLAVEVTPDHETYRPGQTATLAIQTKAGGKPAAAGVGLIGVDQSLGQLVPLPGPSDMASLRDLATMSSPAFGVLDAKALSMGRIVGANAVAATVLRVSQTPSAADIDSYTSADGRTPFDPIAPLTDHFYEILAELHTKTRAWEKSAPKGEVMKVGKMAELFEGAVDAVATRGSPVDDAFGRRLRLHRLPADLLALTDPRAVVIEGTRLPEDVENWEVWVRRNRP